MNPPLRWAGGKRRLASSIIEHMGEHKAYIETCCGGAAVFWAKPREVSTAEILNDADGELINFYSVLHKTGKKLSKEVDSMPYSRKLFNQIRASRPRGSFNRAVRFWYINRVAFGGKRSGVSFGVKASNRVHVLPQSILGELDATIERLRGVLFEAVDVVRLIKLYDRPTSLFYVDPPYLGLSQSYACCFDGADHDRLAEALAQVKGKFILSYNDCSEVREKYSGLRIVDLTTRYSLGRNSAAGKKAGASGQAKEVLILN